MSFSKAGAVAIGLALAACVTQAAAQGIAVTPLVGAYIPGGSFGELRAGAQDTEYKRKATLGLGANIDFGSLRVSAAYASGATISQESGVGNDDDIGDGSVLSVAADLVLRPLPRLIVLQPYLFGGAGLKHQNFSFNDPINVSTFKDESDLTLHIGLGADISLGRLALVAEVSDFISQNNNDDWKTHDAFGMVGLKLRLF
jgi:hypothetical protein